jgi:transcriptional regulator with XRE-family HTH domain
VLLSRPMYEDRRAWPAWRRNVRAAMARKGLGIRGLARAMGGDLETSRRQLRRWLSETGHAPTEVNRRRVADALGVRLEDLEEDEDDVSDVDRALLRALRDWQARREAEELNSGVAS